MLIDIAKSFFKRAEIENKISIIIDDAIISLKALLKANSVFDLIFIDADHTYEGVKSDFNNYLPMLSEGGVLGFHDVESPDWPDTFDATT